MMIVDVVRVISVGLDVGDSVGGFTPAGLPVGVRVGYSEGDGVGGSVVGRTVGCNVVGRKVGNSVGELDASGYRRMGAEVGGAVRTSDIIARKRKIMRLYFILVDSV